MNEYLFFTVPVEYVQAYFKKLLWNFWLLFFITIILFGIIPSMLTIFIWFMITDYSFYMLLKINNGL